MRVVALVLCVFAACNFDQERFDDRKCNSDPDCRPDEECTTGYCIQRSCGSPSDCGDGHEFACTGGACVVRACSTLADCSLGFACTTKFCAAGCADHDEDGVPAGTGC